MSAELIDQLVAHIAQWDWTTFAEIGRLVSADGIPTEGTYALEVVPNGLMWAGMSQQYAEIVDQLRRDPRVAVAICSPLSYVADGQMLRHPVAASLPGPDGYAEPRWLPTAFRPAGATR
ncbi:hypothetical protein [Micromonospora ureilytica]|uniref:Uncharacterized protein n=1 Tax=Micromonospora ureilytica TaxID=709868 RepID=A0ABS0JSP4_9ACTN|nr:hypothetical protein [Micromonospora ureilytica]MBG6070068.1 hypothetical protein [Micromonospora ureilytica]